jgi:hypothetical protein
VAGAVDGLTRRGFPGDFRVVDAAIPLHMDRIKFVIPGNKKDEFLHHLHAMNITAQSLFPGLDGLGASIGELSRMKASYEARTRQA